MHAKLISINSTCRRVVQLIQLGPDAGREGDVECLVRRPVWAAQWHPGELQDPRTDGFECPLKIN